MRAHARARHDLILRAAQEEPGERETTQTDLSLLNKMQVRQRLRVDSRPRIHSALE